MSGHDSDIVFGDIAYREPRRVRRPDRDRDRACLAYEVPRPGELPIFVDYTPADAIERHALSDTSVELGGILLGQECLDDETGEPFVWITQALEAKHYESTQASFTYTHDSWAEINRERDEKFPDLDIVGWYHTHPDFGIFLSGHDLFIQHHFFGQPLQVAYVVDPLRQTRGFFQWRDGQMEAVSGFYVTAERAQRTVLARFVHDLEHFPNNEPTGGMLSPRLEAELIAMLNRPHTATAAAQSPAQSSLLYGLGGMLLGALVLIGGMWVTSLSQSVRDQADAIRGIEKTIKTRADEADVARIDAKEKALDALLREVRIGATREDFLAAYNRVVRERDEARKNLDTLTTDKAALNDLSTRLRLERKSLDTRLADAQKHADEMEESAKKLKQQNDADFDDLATRLKEKEEILKESRAGTLAWKYTVAWYTAAGALAGGILLGLGLIWALSREPLPPLGENAGPQGGTPHRIV